MLPTFRRQSPDDSLSSSASQMQRLVHNPAPTTPRRAAGSIRRTSHIDMIPHGGGTQSGLSLVGVARDVLTRRDGGGVVLDEALVCAELGEGRTLEDLTTEPHAALRSLTGRMVGTGFRAAVDDAAPGHRKTQTPLYLLLDDLPVAALIAGYADLYLRAPDEPPTPSDTAKRKVKADICAGWARDATMMRAIDREGQIPIPVGPAAPAIELLGDPLSWHAIPELPVGAMRRRRRVDVSQSERLVIDAMFRDTHVGPDGTETVLHEYALSASADAESLEIFACQAEARVLPWVECPAAAASAGRLAGQRLPDLRVFVRQRLVGTSTCTHLNDLLRSLADAAPLASRLRAHL